MAEKEWKVPIAIGDAPGLRKIIRGPRDALNFMKRHWPCPGGWLYKLARRRCHASLAGAMPPDKSRKAFIAAMIEADLMFV